MIRAAILIVALALGSVASAQDYSIRLKYRVNIRDAPSLGGSILKTAPVGAVLHVTSELNRWLRIVGVDTTGWVAAWLDYTRVEGGASASSRTSSQVDNCCFVDRQCQSDQDWVSGYWAYQNNQCPAPTQPVAPVSPQPAASPADDVNNCCFVDRQCRSDADWANGYWAYQNGQCRAPSQPSAAVVPASAWLPSERTLTRPIIEGSEWFVNGINSTLNLMQQSAPEWYNYVLNGADKIVEAFNPATPDYPHANTLNWGDGASRTIGVGAGSLSCYAGRLCRVSVAGILAHEAGHIHEYISGIVYASDDPHWHDLAQKAARDTQASIRAGKNRSVR
ncbi:MAG: SH3 domain-containing protein [Chloroflexi bacterium]|nr:SH3 domain-containing protein [Chloroflexota bacterium]